LLAVISISSCTKDDVKQTPYPLPSPARVDILPGTEFIFDGLIWQEEPEFGTIFFGLKNRHDLFFNPYRSLEVSLKLDTLNSWFEIPISSSNNTGIFSYGIDINSASIGVQAPFGYSQLAGRKVSLKIKFL